ncbi:hypothetical protein KVR01_007912 [Diaporthe batatas]|uniref:uncharacterized protein n=1 Tax=Diaporthe batatas TaxID=748121 RepID=UPI001D04F030|nr:uncharacterized protein KVR01_007912 [Diaporthe batatas]KAG8162147.1 hypothetical protein KVR01_007912 [Diaporthe batatas]
MESIDTLTGVSRDVMVARLREVALYAHQHRITLENLTTDQLDIFHRALSRTLGSELAIETFAQIVDGLPTADIAWDKRYPFIFGDTHPIEAHVTICPGVEEKTRTYLQQYDLHSLLFDPQVVQQYQDAPIGSKAFHVRLIELVALGLHQIAVDLFKREEHRCHTQEEIDHVNSCSSGPREGTDPAVREATVPPRPTLFNHPFYVDLDIYPEGLADIVGYWAEDRIIGGVVLFDRKADPRDPQDRPTMGQGEGSEVAGVGTGVGGQNPTGDPPNIWLHSARDRVTYRICQLHDEQQKALVDYLLAAPGDLSNPLPVLPHKGNRRRIDPDIAHTHFLVFREYWDRKPATQELLDFNRRRPRNEGDYPEIRDMLHRVNAVEKEWKEARDTKKLSLTHRPRSQ